MIIGPYSLTVVENEDFGPLVFTYYTDFDSGTLFDFTGYTAQMMVRANVPDVAPVLTLTPTLGGSAGTLSVSLTAAQCSGLVASIPSLVGNYDILLTSPSGKKSHFVPISPLVIQRSVTR